MSGNYTCIRSALTNELNGVKQSLSIIKFIFICEYFLLLVIKNR